MSREFLYEFQELPLLITGGFEAGLVNGSALVAYWPDGLWGITEIYLDGHRMTTGSERAMTRPGEPVRLWEEKSIVLDRGTDLHRMIWDRLEGEWRDKVQDAVNGKIEEDHADAA